METITPRFTHLIGNTPLIDLSSLVDKGGAKLYAKCEFMNPGFSMKDRIAKYILDIAENTGKLKPGDTIVCSSSGNTGCSFAMLGGMRGYKVIVVTSKKCSIEKQNHVKALNAKLIVVDETDYMIYGQQLAESYGYFNVDQYNNPYNPKAYYETLGPEIWRETEGKVTHFVMTGSTFGCISGTGKYLKEQNKNIKIVLADPLHSNIYDYYYHGYLAQNYQYHTKKKQAYLIEGAGKYKPTQCLDFSVIDEVFRVSDIDAIHTCQQLARQESLVVGGSSGLNVFAAKTIASGLGKGNIVVTVLCDSGIKYLSKIYDHSFLEDHGITPFRLQENL